MIRNITVDGEEALAVDTAEELGRALLTGRYVVASDAVCAEYGLTDTDNSDTEDIVDESNWRDDAWRAEGGNGWPGGVGHHRRRHPRGIKTTTTPWVHSTGRRNTSMMRCCDAETETEKVRPGGSACDAFAWSAAGNGACGAATVLEGDRAGAVE